ncbi:MAG: hypothetical protein OXG56_04660 [Gammaproteobacteria bacterium]|nr:hypothetical protein [Gammaproteobacteria bacterium]
MIIRRTFISTIIALSLITMLAGCASITNDANQQINFKAPGCKGKGVSCTATNKRGLWSFEVPGTEYIRRSDDVLKIECEDKDGNRYHEAVPSRMGGKIVASGGFFVGRNRLIFRLN